MAKITKKIQSIGDYVTYSSAAKTGHGEINGGVYQSQILRYPLDHDWDQAPYIRFSCWRPNYNQNQGITSEPLANICLYMPMGIQQADNAQWEMSSSGFVGSMIDSSNSVAAAWNKIKELGKSPFIDKEEGIDPAAIALGRTYGDEALGLAGAATSALFGAGTGGLLTSGAGYLIARQAMNEYAKTTRYSLNPREFMLYRAPSMRQFQYEFRFIPSSEKEAESVLSIIKYLRASMYPELSSKIVKNSTYSFPDVWATEFANTKGLPRIPPCALTDVSVTYNPNSMSFYSNDRIPVEILVSLTLAELAPINRKLVEEDNY